MEGRRQPGADRDNESGDLSWKNLDKPCLHIAALFTITITAICSRMQNVNVLRHHLTDTSSMTRHDDQGSNSGQPAGLPRHYRRLDRHGQRHNGKAPKGYFPVNPEQKVVGGHTRFDLPIP